MSIFYRGRYTIDVSNQSYISAIEKYNQKASITSIKCDNNLDMPKDLNKDNPLENLSKIVEYARNNGVKTIEIDYITANSRALHSIFPKIDTNGINDNKNEMAVALTDRIREIDHAHHYDMGIMFNGSLFDHELSEKEALDALKIACKELNITNAAHLASAQVMIFEYKAECFALRYGKQSDLISLCPFSLDIDDGFINKYEDMESTLDKQIMNQLNSFFKQWKATDYKYNLFPEELSLNLTPVQVQTTVSQIGIFSNSIRAPQFPIVGHVKPKKEIQSVQAGDVCLESYPCQHEITIKYKDGTEKNKWSNGRTIAEKYGSYLDDNDKRHFSEYVKSSFFIKSNTIEKKDADNVQQYQNSNQM